MRSQKEIQKQIDRIALRMIGSSSEYWEKNKAKMEALEWVLKKRERI